MMSSSGPTQVLAGFAGLLGARLFNEKQCDRTAAIHRFTVRFAYAL